MLGNHPVFPIHDGVADMGHSWAAWFIDPSGNVIALVQPKGETDG
jgi:hypothetical protein